MRSKMIPTKADERGLEEIRLFTWMMREHQEQVVRLGEKRRAAVLALRDNGVTYDALSEAMGVSQQAVHKVLRGGYNSVAEAKAAESASTEDAG